MKSVFFSHRLSIGRRVALAAFFSEGCGRQFVVGATGGIVPAAAGALLQEVEAPYLSPIKHPDRALRRRNEVIDAMVEAHAISEAEASTAKDGSLPIMTK